MMFRSNCVRPVYAVYGKDEVDHTVAVTYVHDPNLINTARSMLFLEYEDVLKRPEQRQVSGLTLEAVDELLGELAALIEPVEVHLLWRPQLRDPDDEMVLEAAINGRADALVTYNIRDFRGAAPRFGIRLMQPADLLKEL